MKKVIRELFEEKNKVNISISYVCPNTGDKHTRIVGLGAFSASGGCTGHFHPDEFCYCASPVPSVSFECKCGTYHEIELGI